MKRRSFCCFCSAVLLLSALLGGCSGRNAKTPETQEAQSSQAGTETEPYLQGEAYHWAEGPVKETELPSADELLKEKNLSSVWQSDIMISDRAVWMLVAADNGQKEVHEYCLFFPFEKSEWVMTETGDAATSDGVPYARLISPVRSLSGDAYVKLSLGEGGSGIALVSQEGVGEYRGPITEAFPDFESQVVRSRDGKVYEWLNGDGSQNVFSSDAATNRALLKCVSENGQASAEEVTVDGWILGAVQKDEDSDVLFYGMDRDRSPAMWDENGQKAKIRFPEQLAASEFAAAYTAGGDLAFLDKYGLWEVSEDGDRLLYSFMENGYRFDSALGMAGGEDGVLYLLMDMNGMPTVLSYDLSKKDMQPEKKELVLAMSTPSVAFNNVVADFNRYDPEYYISVIAPENNQDTESFCRQIQLEITAGRGPDLLEGDVLYDIESMKEQGYLTALNGQTFRDAGCIDTALATGMLDGELYGVPYEFSIDFAAYHQSALGDADTLTLDRMMELMENSGVQIADPDCSPEQFIIQYALYDESNTDYIDWEAHRSHLADGKFAELLEFAGEHTVEQTAYEQQVSPEDVFAVHPLFGFYLDGFTELQEALGDYRILGYPRNEGNGIYMWTNRIYVNAQSESGEGAIHFLQYLVGEKAQALYVSYDFTEDAYRRMGADGFFVDKGVLLSVNRSVLELMVEKEDGNNPDNQFVLDDGEILYLKQPLSDRQIEEFWYLVDNAMPAVFRITPLKDMVYEELGAYFEGQCSAQEAAEKLNNRVQLYLDETE